jgi:hypothetical protein
VTKRNRSTFRGRLVERPPRILLERTSSQREQESWRRIPERFSGIKNASMLEGALVERLEEGGR